MLTFGSQPTVTLFRSWLPSWQTPKSQCIWYVTFRVLQEAAGYFKLLHDVAAPQLDDIPSFDASPSCTEMLELLMLAQAQESFYLKANRDKKNPAVLARCGPMHIYR